ncbi:MAG TPA: hypothetical protein VF876_17645 [Burkholderiales bacterium]
MDLTYMRYLEDEGLREELERRAHRARAEEMYRFFAHAAEGLRLAPAPAACNEGCG